MQIYKLVPKQPQNNKKNKPERVPMFSKTKEKQKKKKACKLPCRPITFNCNDSQRNTLAIMSEPIINQFRKKTQKSLYNFSQTNDLSIARALI